MRWSFKLARVAEIEVRVHATFFLLLAFAGFTYYEAGGRAAAVQGVLFTCVVFFCVLLHEFGHALAARRYGIHTPDITLLPIGGLARLERMPEKPSQELVVAIAGPLVNVGIAAILFPLVFRQLDLGAVERFSGGFLPKLFLVNLLLVVFNLIPAFPMDGGRVLRAFLAMRMDYARATSIAATLGQALAIVGGLYGLLHNAPTLVLIGIFIFFGAQSEAGITQMRVASQGLRVRNAMITNFVTLPLDAPLRAAVDALLSTSQHDFPVVDERGEMRGLIVRRDLIAALNRSGADTPVAEVMRVDLPSLHHTMLFDHALSVLQQSGSPALPVLDFSGKLIGLFTPENVGELLMVQKALAGAPHPPTYGKAAEASELSSSKPVAVSAPRVNTSNDSFF